MSLYHAEIVFALTLLCALTSVPGQVTIGISPQLDNYIAALDSNSTVGFNCTAIFNKSFNLQWRVNNTDSGFVDIVNSGVSTTQRAEEIEPGVIVSMSSLYVSTRGENNNTSIRCRTFDEVSNPGTITLVESQLIILRIQGLLDSPPNLTLLTSQDQLSRILSWDAPETLDITNVDPDIQSYRVCYNLTDDLTCTSVSSSERKEFRFLNVRVPLLFTITAINVVGEGSASSVIHQPSGCKNGGWYHGTHVHNNCYTVAKVNNECPLS